MRSFMLVALLVCVNSSGVAVAEQKRRSCDAVHAYAEIVYPPKLEVAVAGHSWAVLKARTDS